MDKLRSLGGADIIVYGDDVVQSETEAARVAADRGSTYISPYNDLEASPGFYLSPQRPPLPLSPPRYKRYWKEADAYKTPLS